MHRILSAVVVTLLVSAIPVLWPQIRRLSLLVEIPLPARRNKAQHRLGLMPPTVPPISLLKARAATHQQGLKSRGSPRLPDQQQRQASLTLPRATALFVSWHQVQQRVTASLIWVSSLAPPLRGFLLYGLYEQDARWSS